jgi:hypothetical protein
VRSYKTGFLRPQLIASPPPPLILLSRRFNIRQERMKEVVALSCWLVACKGGWEVKHGTAAGGPLAQRELLLLPNPLTGTKMRLSRASENLNDSPMKVAITFRLILRLNWLRRVRPRRISIDCARCVGQDTYTFASARPLPLLCFRGSEVVILSSLCGWAVASARSKPYWCFVE